MVTDMNTQVHPDILEVLTKRILPYVIRIQDMDTPWPAQLWVNGACVHQEGVAMFNIGDQGYLTAEYFAYDNTRWADFTLLGIETGQAHLVMADADAVIPIRHIRTNPKARTMYTGVTMPDLKTYNCDIQGWIGGSEDTEMPFAGMTLTNLPDLRLPRITLLASDEDHDLFTMRGTTSRTASLKLTADDWNIELAESRSPEVRDTPQVYHAALTRKDSSLFTLQSDNVDNSIVDALYKFLSFQSGRWMTLSTITCAPVDPADWVVERAWAGKLTPQVQYGSDWTATDWQKWPTLCQAFWNQYADAASHEHLKHAVYHFVECQRIFEEGAVVYSLVAAQSTLQALTRWWTDLEPEHRFDRRGPTFRDTLIKAVGKAELGRDSGKVVDEKEIESVLEKASAHRNDIDHGRGGNIGDHAQTIVALRMYCHNLARLLLLAKFNDHDRDARGNVFGPKFTDMTV